MALSDTEIDELQTALAAGGELDRATALMLLEEVRGSRQSLGLAADAVHMIAAGAVGVATEAARLVDGYRNLMPLDDDGWITDFPAGFDPPVDGGDL